MGKGLRKDKKSQQPKGGRRRGKIFVQSFLEQIFAETKMVIVPRTWVGKKIYEEDVGGYVESIY